MVTLENVDRSFQGRPALTDLSFAIGPGEVVVLVGANGAGKTTAVRLLLGLLRPQRGQVLLWGHSAWQLPTHLRGKIGVLLEHHGLPTNLTGIASLRYYGQLAGLTKRQVDARAEDILANLHFGDRIAKPVVQLSKGDRQKVGLARALLANPALLVLDEPTFGFDPLSQRDVRNMLVQLTRKAGTALCLTSHFMNEVAQLASRVLFLRASRTLAYGTPDQLEREQGYIVEITLKHPHDVSAAAEKLTESAWSKVQEDMGALRVHVRTPEQEDEVLAVLRGNHGMEVSSHRHRRLTLEEIYCAIMEP